MKRRFIQWTGITLLGISLLPLPLQAAPQPKTPSYRSCQAKDLVGAWEMIQQVTPDPINPQDPFYYKYQRYVFTSDGGMKHLTSTTPISGEQKESQRKAPTISTYQVNPDGGVVIRRKDSKKNQLFLCTAITQDSEDAEAPMKAGDLLISYYTLKNKTPVLQRLLRKETPDSGSRNKKTI